jgi:hypothetical protein
MKVRRAVAATVISAVVAFDGLSSAVSAATTHSRLASAPVRAHLRRIIVNFARQNGDPHPTHLRMVAVASTYRVAATGHFVGYAASGPPGAPAPTGIGLWIVVERNSSFRVLAWGISHTDVNLRKYGQVQSL